MLTFGGIGIADVAAISSEPSSDMILCFSSHLMLRLFHNTVIRPLVCSQMPDSIRVVSNHTIPCESDYKRCDIKPPKSERESLTQSIELHPNQCLQRGFRSLKDAVALLTRRSAARHDRLAECVIG
jgi:hypothetical protein